VPDHLARAEAIALQIFARWQRGPYQWQVKHLRWYLEHRASRFALNVQYRHWLTLRVLVIALGKDVDWLPRLKGPWQRPSGDGPHQSGTGRPVKRPT
jgi:hypothetical protein